jgi:hypothetical protein
MAALTPFRPNGPTIVVNAASTPPAPTQCLSDESLLQNYVMTNVGSVVVFMTMGANQGEASADSAVPVAGSPQEVYPLLNGSQVTITGPQNAWFTGITSVTAATVYVTPGYGQ